MTTKDISRRVHENKVSISRGVPGLETKALLHRVPDVRDHRSERLHLTESGREVFATVARRAGDFEAELTRVCGPDLIARLRTDLAAMHARWATRTEVVTASD